MSQQIIDIGTGPSAGDGDPLRTAFNKINNNFSEVYSNLAVASSTVTSVAGRTGNVQLTTQDIVGIINYATVSYVNSVAADKISVGTVPASSKGAAGDQIGQIAANETSIYYCTANYTTGNVDIWVKQDWSTVGAW